MVTPVLSLVEAAVGAVRKKDRSHWLCRKDSDRGGDCTWNTVRIALPVISLGGLDELMLKWFGGSSAEIRLVLPLIHLWSKGSREKRLGEKANLTRTSALFLSVKRVNVTS